MVIQKVLRSKLNGTILVVTGTRKHNVINVGRRSLYEIPLKKRSPTFAQTDSHIASFNTLWCNVLVALLNHAPKAIERSITEKISENSESVALIMPASLGLDHNSNGHL